MGQRDVFLLWGYCNKISQTGWLRQGEMNRLTVLEVESPKSRCAAAAVKSLQSCPTLCDPIDGSPPGSPVPGILQAGTLEWVAISFSNA